MKNKNFLLIIIAIIIVIMMFVVVKEVILIANEGANKNKIFNEIQVNSDDMIGKWNTVSAVNSIDGCETKNIKDVFGSSYLQYGSYLELNEDGTFNNAIQPITDGSKSNAGKYEIKRDYYELGDCYVILSYYDGNEEKLQRVFLDDSNTAYLVLDNLINGYQLTLKK